MDIDGVDALVDRLFESKAIVGPVAGKRRGIGISRRTWNRFCLGLGGFLVSFTLFSVLLFPVFNNKSGLDVLGELFSDTNDTVFVGDNPPVDPPAYDYWYAPENSLSLIHI